MPCFTLMLLTPHWKGNLSEQDELWRLPWICNAGRILSPSTPVLSGEQ